MTTQELIKTNQDVTTLETTQTEQITLDDNRFESILDSKVAAEKLELKNDVKMPPRSSIRKELKKVSNFTDDEIAILYWSSLYKAYSLIVRYEQQGVEDEFRKQEWFQEALKEYTSKKRDNSKNYDNDSSNEKRVEFAYSEKFKKSKSKKFDYTKFFTNKSSNKN